MNDESKVQEKITQESNGDFKVLISDNRRKLIKGSALAVPVIMTLKSGALMAAASSESCIARDQKFADQENPGKFKKPNSDSFLRTEVTIAKLFRIIFDLGSSKWVYDKKTNGKLRKVTVYAHGHSLAPMPTTWEKSGLPLYNLETNIIDVFDEATDSTPALSATNCFNDGTFYYALDTGFSRDGYAEKYGLVVTSDSGAITTDELGGAKVGRFVGHSDVADDQNHLTGSCWSSLTPTSP